MSHLDPTLKTLASSQHGMLTTGQLMNAGLSAPDLVALVEQDVLRHPGRGLYAITSLVSEDPVEWHRQLVAGAFLLYPDAFLTGVSAVLAHGIPVWGVALDKPEIVRPRNRSGGMSAFHVRPVAGRQTGAESPWGPCVPLADALAQVALDAGITPGVVSADAALKEQLVSELDLAGAVERTSAWPGASRVRGMVRHADGRRETPGESRTGVILALLGYDVVPQVRIYDLDGVLVARVDFLIAGTKVVIEFDGRLKYAGDDGSALFAEKRREDRLRSLGYVVVRVVWADLDRPAVIAARIEQALAATAA